MITFIARFLNGPQRTPRSSRWLRHIYLQLSSVSQRLSHQKDAYNIQMEKTGPVAGFYTVICPRF
jgi:hypothetical protein